ncbi:MAG: hypothetical protein WAK48_28980 [Candidatus Acidiferrum sp.]|jgi:hypothetical protein
MSAPERTTHQSILAALRAHSGIKWELDRLEKAADQQIRRTLPKFHYNGEVGLTLLEDLAAVVSSKDWRPPLERSNHQLRDAARHIRKAVRSALRAANGCPTYATISSIVWESTSEAGAERRSIAALPAEDRLFGRGGAIELLRERERRTVVDPETTAPGFLKAMWGYAARCDHEADRIDNILKARNRHFGRLGPILKIIQDVQAFTGKPHYARVARLLADAHEVCGSKKQYSPEAIRKIRQYHLAPLRKP